MTLSKRNVQQINKITNNTNYFFQKKNFSLPIFCLLQFWKINKNFYRKRLNLGFAAILITLPPPPTGSTPLRLFSIFGEKNFCASGISGKVQILQKGKK